MDEKYSAESQSGLSSRQLRKPIARLAAEPGKLDNYEKAITCLI